MIKTVKSINKKLAFVFLFYIFLSFFSIHNFLVNNGTVGHNWDWSFPSTSISANTLIKKSFFVYDENCFGFEIGYFITNIPYWIIQGILCEIFGGGLTSKLFISLILSISSISMFYLIYNIIVSYSEQKLDSNIIYIASFFGGLFYGFSPYLFNEIIGGAYTQLISYSIFPLILLYFRRIIITSKKPIRDLIIFVLLFSAITMSLQKLFIFIFIIMIYITLNIKKIKINKIFLLFVFLMILLLNAWWLFYFINFLTSTQIEYAISQPKMQVYMSFAHNVPDTFLAFTTSGYFDRHFYTHVVLDFFGSVGYFILIAPVILCLLGIMFKDNKTTKFGIYGEYLFWYFVFLIGVGLSSGLKGPLKNVLSNVISYMFLFRSPQHLIFIATLGLSICVGLSIFLTLKKLNNIKTKKLMLIIAILIFLLLNIPTYLSGDFSYNYLSDNYHKLWAKVNVFETPEEYKKIQLLLKNDKKDIRVMYLPMVASPYYLKTFYQTEGQGGDPIILYSPKPTLYSDLCIFNRDFIRILEKNIYTSTNISKVKKILYMLNIKYIVLRMDVLPWHTPNKNLYNLELINKQLDNKLYIINNSTSHNRYVKIYSLKYSLPKIYSVRNIVFLNSSLNDMFIILSLDDYEIENNIIILSNQTNKEQWQFLKNYNNSIIITKHTISIKPTNGNKNPFSWNNLSNNSIDARYYIGWKSVIRTDGKELNDTLTFSSLKTCPYKFPPYSSTGWSAYNSTLIYIKTGSKPLIITKIDENGKQIDDIIGVWWETDWMGMGTKPINFPIVIPPNQRAIIQINHIIKDNNITLHTLDLTNLTKLNEIKSSTPTITFKKINPTKYIVSVENATQPFFLVFSESYHPQWKIYIEDKSTNFNQIMAEYPKVHVKEAKHDWYRFTPGDIIYLFKKPAVNETFHFIANGFANAWYINPKEFDKNKDGRFTIIIYFLPQSLFYFGLFISGATLLCCITYLLYNWKREK
ncbi:hypothetical protein ACPB8Q_06580 [Methanocaldococcus indicus]|uniref:hypothetical protein n=1 Tax=Methanocaldococcus indicus TaxID=213231 RepID=UPI003C6DAC34